jgi:macrolide-specific efflux system membrane fusion protein
MKLKQKLIKKFETAKKIFSAFSLRKKIIIAAICILFAGIGAVKISQNKSTKPQYQTATAQKGTMIIAITGSGQVSAANSASVTTQTSGVVKKIYIQNGQEVNTGDPIAEVDLDLDGRQRSDSAYAGYQSAKNSLDSAKASLYSSQSTMLTQWSTFMNKAENSTYTNPDGSPNTNQRQTAQFMITNDDWLAAEARYKIQQNAILQAQTSLNSAWASYQQSSPVIYAPISGTISGLSLQVGSVLNAQTSSSGNSASQRIANIKTTAAPTITVNLTEIDVPKVQIGNKATVTMDALPDKSFTGKVVSIDTTGSVSSGVTNYPAYISLDTNSVDIFPNMSATANIITDVIDNAILIPSGAVQTQNGESFVRILKNGKVTQAPVTVGVSEGDTVVTNIVTASATSTSRTGTSPFGGGAFRMGGR